MSLSKTVRFISIAALTYATSALSAAYALDAAEAADLVKRYSQTVACQLEPTENYQSLQYKAVKLTPSVEGFEENEIRYVVFWQGDLSCAGGEASRMINFSVVKPGLFEMLPPVVNVFMEFPDLDLIELKTFEEQGGKLAISGLTFGESDVETPTKEVQYTVELADGMLFVAGQ